MWRQMTHIQSNYSDFTAHASTIYIHSKNRIVINNNWTHKNNGWMVIFEPWPWLTKTFFFALLPCAIREWIQSKPYIRNCSLINGSGKTNRHHHHQNHQQQRVNSETKKMLVVVMVMVMVVIRARCQNWILPTTYTHKNTIPQQNWASWRRC